MLPAGVAIRAGSRWRGRSQRAGTVTLLLAMLAASPAEQAPAAGAQLLPLPDVRQYAPHACEAAALQGVLAYFGIDIDQDALLAALGTDEATGTSWEQVTRAAEAFGLLTTRAADMNGAELRAALDAGTPVFLVLRSPVADVESPPACALPSEPRCVVAVGHDSDSFYFEDPAIFGVGVLTEVQLDRLWREPDGAGGCRRGTALLLRHPQGPRPLVRALVPIEERTGGSSP